MEGTSIQNYYSSAMAFIRGVKGSKLTERQYHMVTDGYVREAYSWLVDCGRRDLAKLLLDYQAEGMPQPPPPVEPAPRGVIPGAYNANAKRDAWLKARAEAMGEPVAEHTTVPSERRYAYEELREHPVIQTMIEMLAEKILEYDLRDK